MLKIDWEEFKEYKNSVHLKGDNFDKLLHFLKSYYSVISTFDTYEILENDDLSRMMLEKRDINSPEDLEKYKLKK